ncbi:MAG: glycoside hydrolase family 25 protein [Oscillospiraceae bacterium]
MLKGIDVSSWQKDINWQSVKNSGIEFAILRAGFGWGKDQKDRYFEQNYANAKAVGMPIGAYHYSYATNEQEAKLEAEAFLSWVAGKQFEYPVVLDIEDQSQAALGKAVISNIVRAFCETVENAGYYVSVYANKSWLDTKIDDDCKTRYDIWLAQWAEKPSFGGAYGIWQYSSDGSVEGINGRVDMNEGYKDYPSIIKNNGFNGFSKNSGEEIPVTPPPVPEKKFLPKTMLSLSNTPLFVSASAKEPAAYKSGTYYIYDGILINGRYRITSSPERANKEPIAQNVTGFVNRTDLG